jgi:putative oxidoreductase
MSTAESTRPLIPALSKIYPQASEWGYLLLRVVAGLMLLPHGWPKLMAGPAAVAANVMVRRGVEPALAAAWVAMVLELLGGICIAIGLFTRPVAVLLVIEFLVIVKTHLAAGWSVGAGGAEFAFLWLVTLIYIMLRGGGRYSLDAMLGREV